MENNTNKFYSVTAVNFSIKSEQDWINEFSKKNFKDITLQDFKAISKRVNKTYNCKFQTVKKGHHSYLFTLQQAIHHNQNDWLDSKHYPYVMIMPIEVKHNKTKCCIREVEFYHYDSKRNKYFTLFEDEKDYEILKYHFTRIKHSS